MAKRKYTKKSEYWSKFDKADKSKPLSEMPSHYSQGEPGWQPMGCGENYYVSTSDAADCRYSSSTTDLSSHERDRYITKGAKPGRFSNISQGLLPFEHSKDGISVKNSIELCQKAYANVAIFRNSIDIMSEFANSDLYLEGGTASSRSFVEKWFEKINMWNLKDQYFREYYRSGNIFLYRVDGKFKSSDFKQLKTVYGSDALKPGDMPVKYILLNPYDIVHERSATFDQGKYRKILSDYDLERLKNPKTDRDKEIFKALDPEVKNKIKEGRYLPDGLSVKLNSSKLCYSFYKKQDYEAFAVPFGYSVLEDINWKLELKKIDQAISRTIENVILLITMGAKEEDGGVNPQNINAMQQLFANESVGRVLVADYTTKADFVIPDLKKVIGPEKYEVVNRDIKEGLQNIIVGDERYSNTQVKTEMFLERLKEARNAFLNDFLQPQIKMVCKNLGFRKFPTAKFQEIDIKDEVQLQRVATRLLELGILTPEQGINAIKTGVYPNPEELAPDQEGYSEEREKGFWNPLVGGVPSIEAPGAEKDRALEKKKENQQQKDVPKEVGRPSGTSDIPQENQRQAASYSKADIKETVYSSEKLRTFVVKEVKAKNNIKRLNKQHNKLIDALCENVILSCDKDKWEDCARSCIGDFDKIEKLSVLPEVHDISVSHDLALYPSAILYHSEKK
jgi:hypothetical protein|tara:strand:- start:4253 stop:6286 length:2034 start_codon:yes stop_codon:yes gene_type:complete